MIDLLRFFPPLEGIYEIRLWKQLVSLSGIEGCILLSGQYD
jgi:hypothetical protein